MPTEEEKGCDFIFVFLKKKERSWWSTCWKDKTNIMPSILESPQGAELRVVTSWTPSLKKQMPSAKHMSPPPYTPPEQKHGFAFSHKEAALQNSSLSIPDQCTERIQGVLWQPPYTQYSVVGPSLKSDSGSSPSLQVMVKETQPRAEGRFWCKGGQNSERFQTFQKWTASLVIWIINKHFSVLRFSLKCRLPC